MILIAAAAPGEIGDNVYLWVSRGASTLIAYGDIGDAGAQQDRLGGTVQGYPVQGMRIASAPGAYDSPGIDYGEWSHGPGDLRKSPGMELLKTIALGLPQDLPPDGNDPATRAAAYAVGFVKHIREAFASPKKMGARL